MFGVVYLYGMEIMDAALAAVRGIGEMALAKWHCGVAATGAGEVKKNDVYLAAGVIAVAFMLWIAQRFAWQSQGEQVTVTQDGEIVGVYFLAEDNVLVFTDEAGGQNVLAIRDGKAYMSEADCPDKLCMGQKAISKKGESIICLPHRLVAEVTAGGEAEMDAVAR